MSQTPIAESGDVAVGEQGDPVKLNYRMCAALAGAALACAGTQAKAAEDKPVQIERDYTAYTVNADGTYVESHETAIKVRKESALEMAKDASVGYSTSIQKAEVVAAYTLKPDGRRINAPPGNFQVNEQAGQHGDSPVYSDQSTLTVVFPELAVGDTTVFAYRLIAAKPMFDGQFSIIQSFSPALYYGDVKVTIDAPETLVARHQGWQMKQVGPVVKGGRRIVEWAWQNRSPVDPETLRDGVYKVERYPGYAFSTFADYAQISGAYGAKANAKAVPSDRIRKLAEEISGDAAQPRETAKRLYEWVARNITYAGNCIGLGAVVPRDLDTVLDNKMGDCKDHATLLQALLKAKGIDSTQALINAGQVYELPAIPVASMVNHVINYIPSLDLYLDSTAATAPFGSLPSGAAGKRTLLVDGYRDDSATPTAESGRDWQKMRTTVRIQPDGAVKATMSVELGGRLAMAARDQFRDMPASDVDKLVKRYFQQGAMRATGKLRFDDPNPLLEHFKLEADYEVERMLPVPGGMQVQPWFMSLAPIQAIVSRNLPTDDVPAGDGACSGIKSEEEYVFEFPASLRIAAMPTDLSVQGSHLTYTATYRREGAGLRIERVLDDRTPGPICTADYNTEYAALMRKIMPDLRSQIVYLGTESP